MLFTDVYQIMFHSKPQIEQQEQTSFTFVFALDYGLFIILFTE